MGRSSSASSDLKLAIEAVQRGGEVAADAFRAVHEVEVKPEGKGIVTEADKASEKAIIDVLRSGSPHAVLGEESGRTGDSSECVWVVDPIDGTTNFAKGVPLYVVTVALLRGSEVILGATYHPTTSETFYAERAKGAYVNGRRMGVSARREGTPAIVFLDHGYHPEDRNRFATVTERLAAHCSLRSLGATALAMAFVACGWGDAFVCSGDEIWDFAAGIVLIQEAGGRLTDWRGERWNGRHSFIFASNGTIHEDILQHLSDLQPRES
jgi:myo-inositol-1(or 4)-monophosphatase